MEKIDISFLSVPSAGSVRRGARGAKVLFTALLLLGGLSSCFTGVEGTKRIELSKADRKAIEISAERRLMDSVVSVPLREWSVGRPFLVTDNRLGILLSPRDVASHQLADSIAGKVIRFHGFSPAPLPDGSAGTVLSFSLEGVDYDYRLNRSPEIAARDVTGGDMPMLIDLGMVEQADRLLSGRKVWTRTGLWYTPDGTRFTGRKFVPVVIDSVVPGNSVFPLLVMFSDAMGRPSAMLMNLGGSGLDSRSFESLFSLSDPRLRHSGIDPEVWELICDGKVRQGMTKEECRLSIGSPTDVGGGHDWNRTLDIWKYSDGRYLVFTDGLLTEYRL